MRFKKSACALLLGGGLSVLNIGCTAVDALVSSPAGYSAKSGSPQRIAAIGRVFENQGRYAQARQMYTRALKADPHNIAARDRLEYLASLQSPATRSSATEQALAIADRVAPAKARRTFQVTQQPRKALENTAPVEIVDESAIQMVRAGEPIDRVESAVVSVDDELKSAWTASTVADTQHDSANPKPLADVPEVFDPVGHISFSSDESEHVEVATAFIEQGVEVVSRQVSHQTFYDDDVTEIVEESSDAGVVSGFDLFPEEAEVATTGLWRAASTSVTLEQVLRSSSDPTGNSGDLIEASINGVDSGVKSLAIAFLGEISNPGRDVISALKQASATTDSGVRVAAFDALAIHGENDADTVGGLLGLLTGDDANIRTQAAATLLRLSETRYQDEAIEGLHRLLRDQNDEVVAVAATSLSEFGPAAIPCRERLTEVAASTSSELVLEATSMALSRIPRS